MGNVKIWNEAKGRDINKYKKFTHINRKEYDTLSCRVKKIIYHTGHFYIP